MRKTAELLLPSPEELIDQFSCYIREKVIGLKLGVDGPQLAGKGTIVKILSEILQTVVFNSGIYYRAITHFLIENKFIEPGKNQNLSNLNWNEILKSIEITHVQEAVEIALVGEDSIVCSVGYQTLYGAEVTDTVSSVAACLEVRQCVINIAVSKFEEEEISIIIEARDNYENAIRFMATALIYMFASEEEMIKRAIAREEGHQERELTRDEAKQIETIVKSRNEEELGRHSTPGHGRLLSPEEAIFGDYGYHLVVDTSNITPQELEITILAFLVIQQCDDLSDNQTLMLAQSYLQLMKKKGAVKRVSYKKDFINVRNVVPEEGVEEKVFLI